MRVDGYTKVVLTVIAMMLVFMACKPALQPSGVAAEGPLAGVQFFGFGTAIWGIDTRTGDVWAYAFNVDTGAAKAPEYAGKITQLGKPMVAK
jgi:hypothetical protein